MKEPPRIGFLGKKKTYFNILNYRVFFLTGPTEKVKVQEIGYILSHFELVLPAIIGYVMIWSSLIFSKCETRPPINRLCIDVGGDQFQGQKK